MPHFDDLLFLGASMSRYPLEGYRERCDTDVTLGARHAAKPLHLDIPITIAGMSFGALSAPAKEALGRGATAVGTSTTTGDGGMTPEEREHSSTLVYQLLPSRYGMNPDDLRHADAIEIVVGQGAKPGGGGMLLGQKISDRVAEMRDLPKGIDQRSACRHPDWTGPDDLEIKIHELREITDWQKPIFIKVGATRPYFDVALAVKAGADAVVLDGMQGGTAATQEVFIEHVGIPTLAAIRPAVDALQDLDVHREVQLIVSGGIRTGADVAKALALGADAVSIGVAALIALGDNAPELDADYAEIGSAAGFYDDWHEGRDPAGISTQDDELAARFDPELGGRRLANYLRTMVLEAQTLARACGKSHLHNLEPEDLVALTLEAARWRECRWPGRRGSRALELAYATAISGSRAEATLHGTSGARPTAASPSEDDRRVAVDAAPGPRRCQPHRAREHGALDVARRARSARSTSSRWVTRDHVLLDDRPGVELLGDVVGGRADQLHAALLRPLRTGSAPANAGRNEWWMLITGHAEPVEEVAARGSACSAPAPPGRSCRASSSSSRASASGFVVRGDRDVVEGEAEARDVVARRSGWLETTSAMSASSSPRRQRQSRSSRQWSSRETRSATRLRLRRRPAGASPSRSGSATSRGEGPLERVARRREAARWNTMRMKNAPALGVGRVLVGAGRCWRRASSRKPDDRGDDAGAVRAADEQASGVHVLGRLRHLLPWTNLFTMAR